MNLCNKLNVGKKYGTISILGLYNQLGQAKNKMILKKQIIFYLK
jgi:hypothetical protein